jgi:hypothetical protein
MSLRPQVLCLAVCVLAACSGSSSSSSGSSGISSTSATGSSGSSTTGSSSTSGSTGTSSGSGTTTGTLGQSLIPDGGFGMQLSGFGASQLVTAYAQHNLIFDDAGNPQVDPSELILTGTDPATTMCQFDPISFQGFESDARVYQDGGVVPGAYPFAFFPGQPGTASLQLFTYQGGGVAQIDERAASGTLVIQRITSLAVTGYFDGVAYDGVVVFPDGGEVPAGDAGALSAGFNLKLCN